jgi:OOP family OmpA-OmpF porin
MITIKRIFLLIIVLFSMNFLIGCAGMELAPKDPYPYWYYPKELPEADRAVEAARQAGNDKKCPAEFKAAEDLKNNAYEVYVACRTDEAIAMAKEATAKAKELCPLLPSCTLTALPKEIEKGESTTLILSTSGKVKSVMLDGTEVPVTGATKTVRPTSTISYTAEVTGVGGSTTCSVTVTVATPSPPPPSAPAPPTPAPKVVDKMTLKLNFDFDKADIKKDDEAKLESKPSVKGGSWLSWIRQAHHDKPTICRALSP